MASSESMQAPIATDNLARGVADLATFGYAIHTGFVDSQMLERLAERVDEQLRNGVYASLTIP